MMKVRGEKKHRAARFLGWQDSRGGSGGGKMWLVLCFPQLLGDSPHWSASGCLSPRCSPKQGQLLYLLDHSFLELSLEWGSCLPHHSETAAVRYLEAQGEVARDLTVTLDPEGEGIASYLTAPEGRDKGITKAVSLHCYCTTCAGEKVVCVPPEKLPLYLHEPS